MAIENEGVSKNDIFRAIVEGATEYYKSMITLASAFLGGSLIFMEKLSPSPNPARNSIFLLGCGWLLLIASIVLIALVQRSNLESGRLVMEGEIKKAQDIDECTRTESTWALITLASGIVFIISYGFLNLMVAK